MTTSTNSVAVVDYGMGNLRSVSQAVRHAADQAGVEVFVTADPDVVRRATRVVLPGQGAMPDCMRELRDSGLRESVLEAAASKNDSEAATHESTVLAVLSQRADQVSTEANQCIGEEGTFTNSEQAVTKIDPNISRTENGEMPGPVAGDLIVASDPPQCTSCSR